MSSFADEPGGLNRMVEGLVGGLKARNTDVITASFSDSGDPSVDMLLGPHSASMTAKLRAVRRGARKAMRDSGPDVVAAHFAPYALPALDLFRARPFVFHFHGPWSLESAFEGANPLAVAAKRLVERTVYRAADRMIVLSSAFAEMAASRFGVHRDRIRIVPGGVDTDRFVPVSSVAEARRRLAWENDLPILVTVRRLKRRMGIENLLEGCRRTLDAGHRFRLFVVGSGSEGESLRRRASSLGLDETVRFTGPVEDALLPLVYAAADWSIVPTVDLEGFGLVCVESLSSGTPCLVTPVGGLPEIVRPLEPALVCPGSTPEALAAQLRSALEGRLPAPSPQRCREYALDRFSWAAVADRTIEVYREAFETRRAPTRG